MTCSGVSWWLWSLAQGQHVLLRLESDLPVIRHLAEPPLSVTTLEKRCGVDVSLPIRGATTGHSLLGLALVQPSIKNFPFCVKKKRFRKLPRHHC